MPVRGWKVMAERGRFLHGKYFVVAWISAGLKLNNQFAKRDWFENDETKTMRKKKLQEFQFC